MSKHPKLTLLLWQLQLLLLMNNPHRSVQGVFIANQLSRRLMDLPLVQSQITFNGGGTWQRIARPEKFNNPKCDR